MGVRRKEISRSGTQQMGKPVVGALAFVKKVPEVPKGWLTVPQIAETSGRARSSVGAMMYAARRSGQVKSVQVLGTWYYAP